MGIELNYCKEDIPGIYWLISLYLQKKHTIGFKCPTGAACRYVWRCAIEQMLFFTLPNNHNSNVLMSGGGFFSSTKFRYTGRTEREILSEGKRRRNPFGKINL